MHPYGPYPYPRRFSRRSRRNASRKKDNFGLPTLTFIREPRTIFSSPCDPLCDKLLSFYSIDETSEKLEISRTKIRSRRATSRARGMQDYDIDRKFLVESISLDITADDVSCDFVARRTLWVSTNVHCTYVRICETKLSKSRTRSCLLVRLYGRLSHGVTTAKRRIINRRDDCSNVRPRRKTKGGKEARKLPRWFRMAEPELR